MGPIQNRKDVWLNDLPFSSTDEHGNRWIITDIDGWWDLPTPTMGTVDRAYSEDGSYYEPGRFEARVIRLTGKIIPTSNVVNSANLARQELNRRLMLVRRTGLLQVLESPELGGGKQSEVVIVARPLVSAERLNGVLDFDIQFRAPDPRKYSVDLSVAEAFLTGDEDAGRSYNLIYSRSYIGQQDLSTTVVYNGGDYNTYGTVRLSGPMDNPGVHHLDQGRSITFTDLRLAVGQYIDINLLEKTIISEADISLRDRMDDSSMWFNFDVGSNRLSMSGIQYLDPEPSVPDVKNMVPDPSFEGSADGTRLRTVRRNYTKNPSGTTDVIETILRESVFSDYGAASSSNFSGGTVSQGTVRSPNIKLMYDDTTYFPDTGLNYFVQLELRPETSAVSTAKLDMGNRTSGIVPLTQEEWTTVRVDSFTPDGDIEISLNLPEASNTDRVQIRNIMVHRSPTSIAGEIPFWNPIVGIDNEGMETEEISPGEYRQVIREPRHWTLPYNHDSKLRVIGDDVYLIPASDEDHIVDFGNSSTSGSDITYGVEAEGVTEVAILDSVTREKVHSGPPSHVALNVVLEEPINPIVQATFSVTEGARRDINAVMVTYDGGTRIFTDKTTDDDGFFYDYYSSYTTAREMVGSFVSEEFPDELNPHAREVYARSYSGRRSLEIMYHRISEDEDVPATPISHPTEPLTEGTYFARAKMMSNQPTPVRVVVMGMEHHEPEIYAVQPNHWADVSFEFDVPQGTEAYLAVIPEPGTRDLEIYVDDVGIMTQDEPYFDGSTEGPYVWTGAPNASTSATIPVVGVPTAKMEISFRNAWIG